MENWLFVTAYNVLSFVFQKRAVHQETAFTITKQNFPSCVATRSGRDEFVSCNAWLTATYIHHHARTISAFPPPPPLPPACRREGKNCLAMGEKLAGPHGMMGWASHWHQWMQFGALQCVTWISSSLYVSEGKGWG